MTEIVPRSGTLNPKRVRRRAKRAWAQFPSPKTIDLGRGEMPLQHMLRVMRDPDADALRRDKMAIAAAPYCHPKVAEHRVGKREIDATRARELADGTLKSKWGDLLNARTDTDFDN